MSTGSDEYEDDESNYSPRRERQGILQQRPRRTPATSVPSRIGQITKSLQDTNRNITAVDGLLEDYKDINDTQAKAIGRLRGNLSKSTEQLREERTKNRRSASFRDHESRTLHASDLEATGDRSGRYDPTSPLREYRVTGGASSRFQQKSAGVRFDDSEVHELHQSVRDLSSEQLRLGSELNREVERRHKLERNTNRKYEELSESTRAAMKPVSDTQDNFTDRVELRLREIQDELRKQRLEQEAHERYQHDRVKESREQQHFTREREAVEKEKRDVVSEVKKMVSSQRRDEEKVLREQLLQSEAEKARLASELSASRRNLDESKETKSALEQKIDKLTSDFHQSRDDQRSLQGRLAQYQEVLQEEGIPLTKQQRRDQRLKDAQKRQEIERVKTEREIDSLRQQLSEVTRLRDGDDLRSQTKKTERQREQMMQHINRLNTELEDKERQQGKLLQDLHDMTATLDVKEQEKKAALSQLGDLQKRLKDTSSASEMESLKAEDHSRQLEESLKKRADLKAKAQKIITQWKAKCRRLERELDLRKQDSSQSTDRLDSILRENDNLKTQAGNLAHRMENLQKEMQDILERRAEQDEQLRLRDIEVSELKSAKLSLGQELNDARGFMDKADGELRNQHARLASLEDDHIKQEHSTSRLKSTNEKLLQENKQLHEQIKRYDSKQSEQLREYTLEVSQRRDIELRLGQTEAESQTLRDQVDSLTRKLTEERETHGGEITKYKDEQQKMKEREGRDIQDLTKKLKRERVESEAEIQALRIEISEHRATTKSLRKQLDRSKGDYDQRKDELHKLETDNIKMKRRYDRMKTNYEEQLQANDFGDNRASHLQNQVHVLEEAIERQAGDYEGSLRGISKETDSLVAVISQETAEETLLLSKSPSRSQLEGHPDRWLADLKTKLQWAKEEARNLIIRKRKLQANLNRSRTETDDILQNHLHEKSMIEDEFEKQEGTLHQLAASKKDLEIQNLEKTQELTSLQRQVATLEAHIEKGANLVDMAEVPSLDNPPLAEDLDKLQELQNEKERINERYLKYQGTLALLQQQLEEAKQLTAN